MFSVNNLGKHKNAHDIVLLLDQLQKQMIILKV